jgi:hypothetical protein
VVILDIIKKSGGMGFAVVPDGQPQGIALQTENDGRGNPLWLPWDYFSRVAKIVHQRFNIGHSDRQISRQHFMAPLGD